jgi:chromosome segregation ATPase
MSSTSTYNESHLVLLLEKDNTTLREDRARLENELSLVVEEYNNLEADDAKRAKEVQVLSEAFIETSRLYFGAIRALWEARHNPNNDAAGGGIAQTALTTALTIQDRVQRRLTAAGLGAVAAESALDADSGMLQQAARAAADELRKEERQLFAAALAEVRDHAESCAAELAEARLLEAQLRREKQVMEADLRRDIEAGIRNAAEEKVEHKRREFELEEECNRLKESAKSLALQLEERKRISAQLAPPRNSLIVNGEEYTQESILQLKSKLAEALAANSATKGSANDKIREVERENAELKAHIEASESKCSQLANVATNLQRECDQVVEKHAAQTSLVQTLKTDLASCQAKLAKLHSTKADLARNAQAALKDVEAQVNTLAGVVEKLKMDKLVSRVQ